MSEIKMIGAMDNTVDHTFESANRVYSDEGIAPTISTFCGGGGKLELPQLSNPPRASNRERKDLPDSDNGEYP